MMRRVVLAIAIATTVSCGSCSRSMANLTGWSKSCIDGVSYLQFPSGVTVQYAPDGKVVTCR